MSPKLEITAGPNSRDAKVLLDGEDIAPKLDGLEVHMAANELTRVVLKMPGPFINVMVDPDAVEREYRAEVITLKGEPALLHGLGPTGLPRSRR